MSTQAAPSGGGGRVIALVIEYDGTRYHGFQRQPDAPSIAREVEDALATLLRHPVQLVAAGRTDAGVHATGQVVSFTTASDLDIRRFPIALSALLRDRDIAVVRAADRAPGFSARFDALARTYRYRILNRIAPSPLDRDRVYHVSAALDVNAMRAALQSFPGEHDFGAFTTSEQQGSTRRRVESAAIEHDGENITIEMTADSFLHHMVRLVTGTLVRVGRGETSVDAVARLVASAARGSSRPLLAPAHGLYLTYVRYADPI